MHVQKLLQTTRGRHFQLFIFKFFFVLPKFPSNICKTVNKAAAQSLLDNYHGSLLFLTLMCLMSFMCLIVSTDDFSKPKKIILRLFIQVGFFFCCCDVTLSSV